MELESYNDFTSHNTVYQGGFRPALSPLALSTAFPAE